ncbi:hypothetical protein [Aquimarina litoralis]|uniref:hypothetical protein n=1 Tax=Aquimarina litoralis TaxID=584605 RepID=UPI001C59A893|nr:hypothetical protein [Aquimarina litoralis]MBW1299026.1 hypothetical protein [Aquimarina litoralis]
MKDENQFESYTKLKMVYIFALAPFILVGRQTVEKDLFQLRKENYRLKFKQRLVLLMTGMLFWIGVFIYGYHLSEKERLQLSPEEEIEISKWKKKHGYEE